HDFNNLLTAILGFTNILLKSRPADDPARPDLEQIKKAGERASALTRQLLAFSRKQELRLEVLDLKNIVREMDKMLRPIIGEDVELSTGLAANLKLVKADPNQLEQVILNLAVNARDAMPDGGKLTITTANHRRQEPGGDLVRLSVQDTGAGMDKETQ